MTLLTAQRYAGQIVPWLAGKCDRIEIAGSIRRRRPVCNDIDLVCIPKISEKRDLLGAVIWRENQVHQFLRNYVADWTANNPAAVATPGGEIPRILIGGDREGKQMIVQLPKCQLDIWFADQSTFATRLLCRTGSKEHNIWLCQRAAAQGFHWDPYAGLSRETNRTEIFPAGAESDIYSYLGLRFIAPENRERDWLPITNPQSR